MPTAIPTAIRQLIRTVNPYCMPTSAFVNGSLGVTPHQRTIVVAAIAASAMNVYVISLSFVIDEYSIGLDISIHFLLVRILASMWEKLAYKTFSKHNQQKISKKPV